MDTENGQLALEGIGIIISTVCREENYLASTLDDLFIEQPDDLFIEQPSDANHPVLLVCGSPVTTHLDHYRLRPGIIVAEMGPTAWGWIKNNSLQHRATWNYHRCLTQNVGCGRGSLILEDDVRFARGWRIRLDATVTALEKEYGSQFVLSIYDPQGLQTRGNSLYAKYCPEDFFGTQGVYYPAETKQQFAMFLKRHGVITNQDHYDYLLGNYLLQAHVPLFATTPSLIQHMGRKTTGLGSWHQARNFAEDVRELPLTIE